MLALADRLRKLPAEIEALTEDAFVELLAFHRIKSERDRNGRR